MNQMQIFNNPKFGQVRTIEENGKVLFCGSDIARSLGYVRPNDAINTHCRATVKRSTPISGKIQEINFITEGDIYRLAAKSELPGSEEFESWIFDEVLPSIRKTGTYLSPVVDSKMLYQIAAQLEEKEKQIAEKDKHIALITPSANLGNAMRNNDGLILVRDYVKILANAGIKIKQSELFDLFVQQDFFYQNKRGDYLPYIQYVNQGLFKVHETPIQTRYHGSHISYTTKITGKGQEYFLNKLKEESLCLSR